MSVVKCNYPEKSGNSIRGVVKDNPNGRAFHDAATSEFEEKHHYTGNEYYGR